MTKNKRIAMIRRLQAVREQLGWKKVMDTNDISRCLQMLINELILLVGAYPERKEEE
jgi:hypothetical protein